MQALLSNNIVTAKYTPQRIPQFRGNPLVEALPPSMSDEELISSLTLMPDYGEEQLKWPTSDRLMMLESLHNFMLPLSRHFELCRALDSMLRAGYVGRAPRTPGHTQIFQSIYEKQLAGQTFTQTASSRAPQISTSLIGLSGMGKTTTVNRWCAHLPKVIYHEEHNLYQIPVLHVEMPSDGSSIKGLAHGILQKIDELIPGADYYNQYAQRGRTGADTLMRSVARVMNLHLVGMLVCDETQNLANAKKGGQTAMTELVSACNDLKVPILFIGTNKAAKVLSADFRQSRRASGHGIAPWERLERGSAENPSEWDILIEVMWKFQWVQSPVALDHHFLHIMYECTQGVIDLGIKLFASAQARAILDGSETLTPELLVKVFNDEFKLMHPMVEALRTNNLELLNSFDDIAPLNLQQHLERAQRKLATMKSPLFSVRPGDATFEPRLEQGLTSFGIDPDEAHKLAKEIADTTSVKNLAGGLQKAVESLTKPKPVSKKRSTEVLATLPPDRFDARPNDYRQALAWAEAESKTVLIKLQELGMAPLLDDILAL